MKKGLNILVLILTVFSILCQSAWPLAVPNTFTTGTTISASEVNSNFSTIYTDYTAKMDPSTGHRHSGTGTDGTKVYGTDINSTGGKVSQVLRADGSNASTWVAPENMLSGRLEYQSATQIRYNIYNGRYLEVNNEVYAVDGTVAGGQVDTVDNLITAAGADAGAAMAASTVYYVYCSNASASPFPSDCRASATAATAYRGGQYLAATGNGANWRLVGMVRTNGSTQFADSATQRFVKSYLNRLPAIMENSKTTNTAITSVSSVEIDSTIRCDFLTWADEEVFATSNLRGDHGTGGEQLVFFVDIDGTIDPPVTSDINEPTAGYLVMMSSFLRSKPGAGYHTARAYGRVAAGTGNYRQYQINVTVTD